MTVNDCLLIRQSKWISPHRASSHPHLHHLSVWLTPSEQDPALLKRYWHFFIVIDTTYQASRRLSLEDIDILLLVSSMRCCIRWWHGHTFFPHSSPKTYIHHGSTQPKISELKCTLFTCEPDLLCSFPPLCIYSLLHLFPYGMVSIETEVEGEKKNTVSRVSEPFFFSSNFSLSLFRSRSPSLSSPLVHWKSSSVRSDQYH